MVTKKMITVVMALGVGLLLTQDASARGPRARKSWVPQEAWNAIKARAGQDMGTNQVKLYKSRWSKKLSKGLQGHLGTRTPAYVVHAKSTGRSFSYEKKKGPYLAVKSRQGNWEVFPLALAANKQGRPSKKHITKADGMKENNTYAWADGWLGGTKVVQAVKAKNTLWTSTQEGQLVASKGRGRTKTLFILGDPNRQGSDPAAYAKVKLFNFLLPRRPGPVPMPGPGIPRPVANGERNAANPPATIMPIPPPHPRLGGELNTKFLEVPKPLHGQGQPRPRPQS
jgi:hypothetical protein